MIQFLSDRPCLGYCLLTAAGHSRWNDSSSGLNIQAIPELSEENCSFSAIAAPQTLAAEAAGLKSHAYVKA